MRETFIYALVDPNTDEVRYIGQTIAPKARYANHLCKTGTSPKDRWVSSLREREQRPTMRILECLPDGISHAAKEKEWIDVGLDQGWPLLNVLDPTIYGSSRKIEPGPGSISKTEFSAMTAVELMATDEVLEVVSNKTVIGYFAPAAIASLLPAGGGLVQGGDGDA